jgi:hypothetical protein
LLLAFVFFLGAQWGYDASQRASAWTPYHPAIQVQMAHEIERKKSAGQRMVNDANQIDWAVIRFNQRVPPAQGALASSRDALEQYLLRGGSPSFDITRKDVVRLAEFRLRELSAAAADWQATSDYCEKNRIAYELDVRDRYRDFARAYSSILGREIRPEDIAPAVLGWTCPGNRKGLQS